MISALGVVLMYAISKGLPLSTVLGMTIYMEKICNNLYWDVPTKIRLRERPSNFRLKRGQNIEINHF